MTCRDTIGFLLDYLEHRLPEHQQASFERHLSQCPSCADYLTTYRATLSLGRDALLGEEQAEEIPGELLQGILAALEQGGPPSDQG